MITSDRLENSFAARTTMANTTATKNSRTASLESFFWRGVPTLTPRKRPMASVVVSVYASRYLCGFAFQDVSIYQPISVPDLWLDSEISDKCRKRDAKGSSSTYCAVRFPLDRSNFRALLTKSHGDSTDFSIRSRGEYNPFSSTLRDGRGAECNIESVTRASVVVEDNVLILQDRK